MMELRQSYAFSEGAVRFDVLGSGPPLVLVHGTPWSSHTWRHLVPVLAERYQVHLYDLIGYGQSEKREEQRVSLDAQGELLAELLAHWRLESPLVVAHDFGGATVLRAHLLGGRDYARLALLNVVAMAPWGSPFFAHVQKHEAAFAGVPAYIHKAMLEAYIRTALYRELPAEDFAALLDPWLTPEGQPAFYRQIAQADQRYTDEVEPRYAEIRCPVKILWGDKDEWIPIETGRRLHAAIPGSDFQAVPDAGHLVQLDAPRAVEVALLDFLS